MRRRGLAILLLTTACDCGSGETFEKLTPAAVVEPTTLHFESVPLGATRRLRASLRSAGTAPLVVHAVTSDSPFLALAASSTLAPGTSTVLELGFRPIHMGPAMGVATVRTNDPNRPTIEILLDGEGGAPSLQVSPSRVDLCGTPIGVQARAVFNASNGGTAALSVPVEPVFSRPEHLRVAPAALSLEPLGLASVGLDYAPLAVGDDTGYVRLRSCGPDCGVEVEVLASAIAPLVRALPSSLDFGVRGPGEPTTLVVQLRNEGSRDATLEALEVRGPTELGAVPERPFPTVLQPGGELQVQVTWSPTLGLPLQAWLSIRTGLPELPELRVPVKGEVSFGALTLSPEALDLGVVRTQGPRSRRAFLLANEGRGRVEVTAIELGGDRALHLGPEATAPLSLGAGESITGYVELDPVPAGIYTATVTVRSTDPVHPVLTLPIRAAAADSACDLALEPGRVAFGFVAPGASRAQVVTLRNRGSASCSVTGLALAPGTDPAFALTNPRGLPLSLGPGATATVSAVLSPTAEGQFRATLEALTTDPVRPRVRAILVGTSVPRGRCLSVEPSSLDLGYVAIGARARGVIVVHSIGNETCHVNRALRDSGSASFTVTPLMNVSLNPGTSAQLPVEFLASRAEVATAEVLIATDDPLLGDVRVPLRAVSEDPSLCVTPLTHDFGSGRQTQDQAITISACGTSPVELLGVDFDRRDAELTLAQRPSVPQTLSPGQSVQAVARHTPVDDVPDEATVIVRSRDRVTPRIEVQLTSGPAIVPPAAGRALYYWRIGSGAGDIMKLPLQGGGAPRTEYGPSNGHGCAGCHAVSKDGEYLGMVEFGSTLTLTIKNTRTQRSYPLAGVSSVTSLSFEPIAGSTRLVYSDGRDLHLADARTGVIGPISLGPNPPQAAIQPAWGPGGRIYFAQAGAGGGISVSGLVDLASVPVAGGSPTLVPGASANGLMNYYPAISPDGAWLAFTQAPAGATVSNSAAQLRVVATSGAAQFLALPQLNDPSGAPSSYPTWSVDGRYLSFSSARRRGMSWDLYTSAFDPQTGNAQPPQLVPGADTPDFEHAALWSP